MVKPALPSYLAAAEVLEKDKGAGWRLAGYTVLRTLMIAPPMMLVGVDAKRAWAGAVLSSGLMSVFVLLRIFDARNTGLMGLTAGKRRSLNCATPRALSGSRRASAQRRPTRR